MQEKKFISQECLSKKSACNPSILKPYIVVIFNILILVLQILSNLYLFDHLISLMFAIKAEAVKKISKSFLQYKPM